MNNMRKTLPILLALAPCLTQPLAASEACRVDFDTPAVVVIEAASEVTLDVAAVSRGAVVLEASPRHLVVATDGSGNVDLESSGNCELLTTVTSAEVRRQFVSRGTEPPTVVISFFPLLDDTKSAAIPSKEEDHEFDPDPGIAAPQDPAASRPLITLIELGTAIPSKEEDHEFDPDPGFAAEAEWTGDWTVASAVVGELGSGWYFVVRGGVVTQEVLIEPRS